MQPPALPMACFKHLKGSDVNPHFESMLAPSPRVRQDGYTFYIAWIYVGVAFLVVSLGFSIWIARCFKKNSFTYIWWVPALTPQICLQALFAVRPLTLTFTLLFAPSFMIA